METFLDGLIIIYDDKLSIQQFFLLLFKYFSKI